MSRCFSSCIRNTKVKFEWWLFTHSLSSWTSKHQLYEHLSTAHIPRPNSTVNLSHTHSGKGGGLEDIICQCDAGWIRSSQYGYENRESFTLSCWDGMSFLQWGHGCGLIGHSTSWCVLRTRYWMYCPHCVNCVSLYSHTGRWAYVVSHVRQR